MIYVTNEKKILYYAKAKAHAIMSLIFFIQNYAVHQQHRNNVKWGS